MPFKEGEDFYYDHGLMVLTESYLLKRGFCCNSGCRNCPYKKKNKVAVSWSGGKDSALALWHILQDEHYHVDHLFTILDQNTESIGLHGVPGYLIEKQAAALGLPLKKLYLPTSNDHAAYEKLILQHFEQLKNDDIKNVVYGDIFLEDLKSHRDNLLESSGLKGLYPLWKKNTFDLLQKFISDGFKTVVCAANAKYFPSSALGQLIDRKFINNLPTDVDPGGENGEFHTFVFDGPAFKNQVEFSMGNVIEKEFKYKIINSEGKEELLKTIFLFREMI